MQPERTGTSNVHGLSRSRPLNVGGIVPFTATDFPGLLAAVVFVQGCPWRCGYCHNPHLQRRTRQSAVAWGDVMAFLKRRVGLIDGVVFSGGEPTADPAIVDAVRAARSLGFKIGLHSGGTYPHRFAQLLPFLDWVGLDVKAPFEDYARITRVRGSGDAALECLQALMQSGIDYECRTTLHPDLLPEADVSRLVRTLAAMGVKKYVMQVFRKQGCEDDALNSASVAGYPGESLVAQARASFPAFDVRRG